MISLLVMFPMSLPSAVQFTSTGSALAPASFGVGSQAVVQLRMAMANKHTSRWGPPKAPDFFYCHENHLYRRVL
jgi:hypothetical protein